MEQYGVFISYRREDWALAGRIFDYLKERGYCPFIDTSNIHAGRYDTRLDDLVASTPYFLLVLTPNTFKRDCAWILRELRAALRSESCTIIAVAADGFRFPWRLPKDVNVLRNYQSYPLSYNNFHSVMETICTHDLKADKLVGRMDWKAQTRYLANTFLTSRYELEELIATGENRFGKELTEAVEERRDYTGETHIRYIRMSCYAASLIFAPDIHLVDQLSYDRMKLSLTFRRLLEDEDFTLQIVLTAPFSEAAAEAETSKKVGNSSLDRFPHAAFLSAYSNLQRLIREDAVYKKAYEEQRFQFYVTDIALPHAVFQIVYKPGFEKNDHIKVDLYSEGLTFNKDRRSMVIFREDNPQNYEFFVKRFAFDRNPEKSEALIRAHHDEWLAAWDTMKGEIKRG